MTPTAWAWRSHNIYLQNHKKIWCKQYNSFQLNPFTIRKQGLTVKTEYHIKTAKDTEDMRSNCKDTQNNHSDLIKQIKRDTM